MKPRLFAGFVLAAAFAAICSSQVATGNLRGKPVSGDSTGGRLPNCSVTITHTSTGLVRKVVTNEQGDYNALLASSRRISGSPWASRVSRPRR